ncbi:MAG: hypothetical protein ABI644_09365 [Arenimonas sp.]
MTEVTKAKPINLTKVYLGAGFSLSLIIFGYYASRLFPGINTDAIEAIIGIGSLFSTFWGLKASGLLKPAYFWLAVSMIFITPAFAYFVKNI